MLISQVKLICECSFGPFFVCCFSEWKLQSRDPSKATLGCIKECQQQYVWMQADICQKAFMMLHRRQATLALFKRWFTRPIVRYFKHIRIALHNIFPSGSWQAIKNNALFLFLKSHRNIPLRDANVFPLLTI